MLITKLKKKGFDINYYHTHQDIFEMLTISEKKKLKDIFDFYEQTVFFKIENQIFKRLKINFKILKY